MKNNLLILMLLLTGCTNHLYHGKTSFTDGDRQRDVIIYWHDTTHWLSDNGKPDTVTLLAACYEQSIQFADHGDAVTFIASAGRFSDVGTRSKEIDSSHLLCGEVSGKKEVQLGSSTRVEVKIYCKKNSKHPLKLADSPPAIDYIFDVVVESVFSFFGEQIEPPDKPDCIVK